VAQLDTITGNYFSDGMHFALSDLAVVVTTAVFHTDKSDDVAMLLLKQLIPALEGS
jgi:hypothetical protein